MGEISYRKRGKKWEYRFEGAPINGKRNQISKGGFSTKAECIEAAEIAKRNYTSGGQVLNAKEISIADYLDYWYDTYCVMNLRYNTLTNYAGIINKHLKPTFGMYKLNALSTAAVQDYTNSLKRNGMAKSTVVGIISVLSGAYEYAIEPLRYVNENPCSRVKYPRFERTSDKGHYYIESETFEMITELFKDKLYYLVPIIIGYRCGLRIGEVFGLTWEDIDFEKNTLTVNRQIVKRNFGVDVRKAMQVKGKKKEKSDWYFAPPKTITAYRTVSVDSATMALLKKYNTYQKENMLNYGEYYTCYFLKDELNEKGDTIQRLIPVSRSVPCDLPQTNLVMVREDGTYISTDSFKYASRVIHNKINAPFDFHSLRHTHATMLAESGANPEVVRRRLGHSDIKVTLQYYTHATQKLEDDMMDKLEELFVHNSEKRGQSVDKTS